MFRLLLVVFCLATGLALPAQTIPFNAGQFIVQLSPGTSERELLSTIRSRYPGWDASFSRNISQRFSIRLLKTATGNEHEKLQQLRKLQGIQAAQLNHRVHPRSTEPDDPAFNLQWALHNTGQGGGTPGADIRAPEAWDITTGGHTATGDTIVVAVIDDGFQLNHPDLVNNIFRNYGEIPGNGMDDDGNGYIDDISGWNAYDNNGMLTPASHGTHVAGIIGAEGNNGKGVAGINWNIKLLPVQGASEDEATVLAAYAYVADMRIRYNESEGKNGAFVVATNSSFGVNRALPDEFPLWCAFYDSLGAYGILSIASTTNSNFDVDQVGDIPTTCVSEFMIAVTASSRDDTKTSAAGYGMQHIDIAAPGMGIYSTITGSSYGTRSGTSMAAPHVAGAVALLYPALCASRLALYKNDPHRLALYVKEHLYRGADSLGALNGLVAGSRRLNLAGALHSLQRDSCTADTVPPASPAYARFFPNPVTNFLTVEVPPGVSWSGIVSDVSGRVVWSGKEQMETTTAIPFGHLAAGIYFVVAEVGGRRIVNRIIYIGSL